MEKISQMERKTNEEILSRISYVGQINNGVRVETFKGLKGNTDQSIRMDDWMYRPHLRTDEKKKLIFLCTYEIIILKD